jgi:hypothetical protein
VNEQEKEIEVVVDDAAQPDATLEHLKTLLKKHHRANPVTDAHLLAIITTGRLMGPKWCGKWAYEFSSQNKVGMEWR